MEQPARKFKTFGEYKLFKHEVKDYFLETLNREEKNIYTY